jgi:hypothetical protein
MPPKNPFHCGYEMLARTDPETGDKFYWCCSCGKRQDSEINKED